VHRGRDFINRRYRHRGVVDQVERPKNRTKSKVRAKVEHPIGLIKRVFGFAKVRYRGPKKNLNRLLVTSAPARAPVALRRGVMRLNRASASGSTHNAAGQPYQCLARPLIASIPTLPSRAITAYSDLH
jgi:hypothetical protein